VRLVLLIEIGRLESLKRMSEETIFPRCSMMNKIQYGLFSYIYKQNERYIVFIPSFKIFQTLISG